MTEAFIAKKKAERKEESIKIVEQLKELQKENQKLLNKLLKDVNKL
jgi:hypothetical protein